MRDESFSLPSIVVFRSEMDARYCIKHKLFFFSVYILCDFTRYKLWLSFKYSIFFGCSEIILPYVSSTVMVVGCFL